MGDPVSLTLAAVSTVGSLAATGLGARAKVKQGQAQQQADQFQAQQLSNAAEIGRTQAAQTSEYFSNQIARYKSNVQALTVSRGMSGDSPTSAVLANYSESVLREQKARTEANIGSQVLADQQAAGFYVAAGKAALKGSYMDAAGGLLGALSKASFPDVGGIFTQTGGLFDYKSSTLGALY